MAGGVAYVDTSAFFKLLQHEPESDAFRSALLRWPILVSSEILGIEMHRAAYRQGLSEADCQTLLTTINLVPLTDEIRTLARRIGSPKLRALDAIHMATAASLGPRVGAIFVYDHQFIEDALLEQMPAVSPAPDDTEAN